MLVRDVLKCFKSREDCDLIHDSRITNPYFEPSRCKNLEILKVTCCHPYCVNNWRSIYTSKIFRFELLVSASVSIEQCWWLKDNTTTCGLSCDYIKVYFLHTIQLHNEYNKGFYCVPQQKCHSKLKNYQKSVVIICYFCQKNTGFEFSFLDKRQLHDMLASFHQYHHLRTLVAFLSFTWLT